MEKLCPKKAYKMLKEDKESTISEENLIILNPQWGNESKDADLMRTKMDARRARVKALKKAAKECKRKLVEENGSTTPSTSSSSATNGDVKKSKIAKMPSTSTSDSEKKGKFSKSVQQDPSK